MNNKEKYEEVFLKSFALEKDKLNKDLVYESVSAWDSIGHMGMIAELEDVFEIELETDDIIDFSSFEKGKEILKKYSIIIQ
ncbi:MAG: acyl carrier protein [Candidatus Margulisiibacteriota bacterium]